MLLILLAFAWAASNAMCQKQFTLEYNGIEMSYFLPRSAKVTSPPARIITFREDRPLPRHCNLVKFGLGAESSSGIYEVLVSIDLFRTQYDRLESFHGAGLDSLLKKEGISTLPDRRYAVILDERGREWLSNRPSLRQEGLISEAYCIAIDSNIILNINALSSGGVSEITEKATESLLKDIVNSVIVNKLSKN